MFGDRFRREIPDRVRGRSKRLCLFGPRAGCRTTTAHPLARRAPGNQPAPRGLRGNSGTISGSERALVEATFEGSAAGDFCLPW
jgi:hypothetical protein